MPSPARRPGLALVLGALALAALGALLEPALAAGATGFAAQSGVGEKVGSELSSWGAALVLAVAALVALPLLAKRDAGGIVVLILIATVIGGFVFAPQIVEGIINDFWGALRGGQGEGG